MSIVTTGVAELLKKTEQLFSDTAIPSPRLDAEVLLAHILEVNRAWLVAHSNEDLSAQIKNEFEALVQRRLNREPVAYIVGKKEFYGREFVVTPDVLIPRPETETLVEELVRLFYGRAVNIHDVGTGSGCVAISCALELRAASVAASDISLEAIKIARHNALALDATNVLFRTDNLMQTFHGPYDAITANLPYVDPEWDTSPEIAHEPRLALYAEDHGLSLIFELLDQVSSRLVDGGYLLLEADPQQHEAIIERAMQNGLVLETVRDYIVVLRKA